MGATSRLVFVERPSPILASPKRDRVMPRSPLSPRKLGVPPMQDLSIQLSLELVSLMKIPPAPSSHPTLPTVVMRSPLAALTPILWD